MNGDSKSRDLAEYQRSYLELPFEVVQAEFRREYLLKLLEETSPGYWMEVGCGLSPLFEDYPFGEKIRVIEPGSLFFENASKAAEGYEHIEIINSRLEDLQKTPSVLGEPDVIVLSALLHEVEDSREFLNAARDHGGSKSLYIITVPNALSFHRLYGEKLYPRRTPASLSATQIDLQQRRVYNPDTLSRELLESGFEIQSLAPILFKPFTHAQMQALIDFKIFSIEELRSLSQMAPEVTEFGSEILVTAVLSDS